MRPPSPRALALLVAAGLAAVLAWRLASGGADPLPTRAKPPLPRVEAPWRGEGATIEVTAWELYCPGCVKGIRKAIGAIEGVASVEADAETSVVTVRLADPALREGAIPRIRDAIHAQAKKVLGEDAP